MMKSVFLVIASAPRSLLNFRGDLIDRLIERDCDVHVAAPFLPDFPECSAVRADLEKKGCTVHHVPFSRTGISPFHDWITLYRLYSLVRMVRPSCMLSYTIKPVVYGLLVGRLLGVKYRYALITGLGYAFSGKTTVMAKVVSAISRLLYPHALVGCHRIFFQNPDDQKVFFDLGLLKRGSATKIINGSGVDLAKFSPVEVPVRPHFLMIGRLLGSKGVREYAQASIVLKKRYPDVDFSLVGWLDENPDSISEDELDYWISQGLLFHGRLEDVRPAIANCSVYVLPSYREGTPRTVLEAMALGRAVITTDAPGCRQTVVDGVNGFLVEVGSSQNLQKAMENYILDPELAVAHGRKSLSFAREKYDVRKVNAEMLAGMGIFP